jgi:hypothetical protein
MFRLDRIAYLISVKRALAALTPKVVFPDRPASQGGLRPCKEGRASASSCCVVHLRRGASFVENIAICIAANFAVGKFELKRAKRSLSSDLDGGQDRVNQSDPAGATACRAAGRLQRRQHRIPAP